MATLTPAQQFQNDINSLKSKIDTLQDGVRLSTIRDSIEDLQTSIKGMDQQLKNLRQDGYIFEKNLESQIKDYISQLSSILPNVQSQINTQSSVLSASLRTIESQFARLSSSNPALSRQNLERLKTDIGTLDGKVSSAEKTITGMYDNLKSKANQTIGHLKDIEWMLKQINEGSFTLTPTESGIMAVKSVWSKSDKEEKDDPEGVLLLTDQRILFEQKEKKATKKILFIATEKETVQNLLIDIPISLVEEVKTIKRGIFKNEDHLEITFSSGAQVRLAYFHIWQDCATWQGLINKAKTKDFDSDRVVDIDEKVVQKIQAAPTICPTCGGKLDQAILRGMDTITCEYCGGVVRL